MSKEEIKKELEELKIVDNPYDVLFLLALQLARKILIGSGPVHDDVISEDEFKAQIRDLNDAYYNITYLSDDAKKVCRETAEFYDNDTFNMANKMLFGLEKELETTVTRLFPCRDDEYEKARLGKDSQEYKRLQDLKSIARAESVRNLTKEDLNNMLKIIDSAEKCLQDGMDYLQELQYEELIARYNFHEEDIKFLLSYMFKE